MGGFEAVWLTREGQQWEVVVRLRGGDLVSYLCRTREEARERISALVRQSRELNEAVQAWPGAVFPQLVRGAPPAA